MTHFGHWVGNEQEAIAYYRKAFEIDSALETARDNLKLLGATLERASLLIGRQNPRIERAHGRMRVYDI